MIVRYRRTWASSASRFSECDAMMFAWPAAAGSVLLQAPEASRVAGFQAWRKLGRQVRRGETGIRIIAPIATRKRDAETSTGEDESLRAMFFRMVPVFDVAQTDPIPGVEQAPLEPPSSPITGESHAHLIPVLCEFAASLGFTVRFQEMDWASGFCDRAEKRIGVKQTLPANARVRVLIPRLARIRQEIVV